jgi:hypothetical protein
VLKSVVWVTERAAVQVCDKVRDLTDSWVGAIRKGTGIGHNGAASQKSVGARKPIKRSRVQLSMLPGALGAAAGGFGGAGKDAQEHFGAYAKDADEMEYNMWRMERLRKGVEEEAPETRKRVCSFAV